MPEQSARLGIPLPLGNENVSRQAIREMLQAVDDHAETIAGAQAKADAAEAAAKAYADSAAGSAAGAVASALAAHKADFTQQIPYAVTAGSANTYTASTSPALPALVAGVAIAVKIHAVNTGAATLNWNGKGAKAIKKANGSDVSSGNLKLNGVYTFRYDGTSFILQGEGGEYGTAGAAQVLTGYTFGTESGLVSGTMPSNSSQTATLQITGSAKPTKAVPAGYSPGGTITAELAAALASKILLGNTIGGVAGTAVDGNGMLKLAKTTETISGTVPISWGQVSLSPNTLFKTISISGLAFTPEIVAIKVSAIFSQGNQTNMNWLVSYSANADFPSQSSGKDYNNTYTISMGCGVSNIVYGGCTVNLYVGRNGSYGSLQDMTIVISLLGK